MRSNGFLDDPAQYSFITCGDWDLKTALPQQLSLASSHIHKSDSSLLQTHFIDRLINLKWSYKRQYNDRYTKGMTSMLKKLGMKIQGRHHSGIDDCKNILRIVERMLDDGWNPSSDLPL
jgi:ERI1 exoribonuclease 3